MKRIRVLGAAWMLAALLAGCSSSGALFSFSASSDVTAGLYDDAEQIAGEADSYTLVRFRQSIENQRHWTASAGKMEGMDTLWSFEAEEAADVEITCTLNVSSGRLKLVWIDPAGDLTVVAESDGEMEEPVQSTLHVDSGTCRLKLVAAEDTGFTADLTVSQGEIRGIG